VIVNKKSFTAGVVLTVLFFLTLTGLHFPLLDGKTGMELAEEMFNSFAKGSTYLIPEMQETCKKFMGHRFMINMEMDELETTVKAAKLLAGVGAEVEQNGTVLKVSGDLGEISSNVLEDADAVFNGRGGEITDRYGYGAREIMYNWWLCFQKMEKAFNRNGSFQAAALTGEIKKKAIEPAYNFYGVESRNVNDNGGILTSLLVFYIIYTVWWGFAIYFLFEGFGIAMTKAEEKTEY